jgi:hypothetical protein
MRSAVTMISEREVEPPRHGLGHPGSRKVFPRETKMGTPPFALFAKGGAPKEPSCSTSP